MPVVVSIVPVVVSVVAVSVVARLFCL